jgi:hypothetical protein
MAKESGTVLTESEAMAMLEAVHQYFNEDNFIKGHHFMENMVEDIARDGLADLAKEVNQIHATLKEFHRGDFKSANFFEQGDADIFKDLREKAKGTRWEEAATKLAHDLKGLEAAFEELPVRNVDWEASAEVLTRVKTKKFPDDLSMTERLGQWQRSQSAGVIL